MVRSLRPTPSALFLSALLQGACLGSIGSSDAPGDTGGPPATTPGGTPTETGPNPAAAGARCANPQAPALHARLLTPSQYDNTLQDLFRVTGSFAKNFGGGVDAQLDDVAVELRANAASTAAQAAVQALAQWSPCDPVKMGDAPCGQRLIDVIGPRLYRRPLRDADRTQLLTLFKAGLAEKDFATGVEWLLTGALQAPDFLYQVVRPAADERAGQVRALDPYELASRLAFFLWDSAPDDALLAAAGAGDLADAGKLQAQLDRLQRDPRAARGVKAFHARWLGATGFGEVARDDKAFTTDVVNSLQTSLLENAAQVHAATNANLDLLFSGQGYLMDATLRKFYGLPAAGAGFQPADFPGEQRRGLLTHPAFLTLLARPDASNPISRGLFVRRKLLCQDLQIPQGLDVPPLPPAKAGASTRDRLTAHARVPACAGCHDLIDAPGFALEGFDQVGRARAMDGGKPVDTSGNMTNAGELEGAFARGDELLQRIPGSKTVRACFMRRFFEYALERDAADADQCALGKLESAFTTTGDLRALARGVATSDPFRLRASEGAPR